MKSIYRDVLHLSASELALLRSALFWGCCEEINLSASQRSAVKNAEHEKDISDEIVFSAFGGYLFCDDDFIR